ncbi:MAG: HAD family hydrolase [Muribaculaceae bacterium]|nr:HAD family hydrolase [Muribaculaceae bacterium]
MANSDTLYITDLDGTLLDANSCITDETVSVLNPLLDQGLQFTVATARTPATVVPMLSRLHTRLPFIVLNGAATWDSQRGDYSHVNVIPQATVEAICAVYERHGLHPLIYRRHGHLIHTHHYGTLSPQEEKFVEERQGLELKKFIMDDPDYKHSPDEAMLIFSMQDYVRLRPIYEEVKATIPCSAVFYRDIFDPTSGLLEIYAPGVSKAEAVKAMQQHTGAKEVIVFGDNRNDIPMMQVATHSVAVANAFPEVKAAAHEVIEANTTNAVPRYIATRHF